MQCKNCGTNNFDVAVACARCHAPLVNTHSEGVHPVYRSNPDPEPPTQISGVGFENVRFGPAPSTETKKQSKKFQRPRPQAEPVSERQRAMSPPPVTNTHEEKKNHPKQAESSVVLFGVFAFSLGISFIILCIDFYSFFLLLQNR